MKKRFIFAALSLALMLAMTGCTNTNIPAKDDDNVTNSSKDDRDDDDKDRDSDSENNSSKSSDLKFETEAEYLVFNVNIAFEIESDAWLGVIPTGTIYEKEVDADEVDIVYTYCENYGFDGATSYRFAFEKDYLLGIEDGTYDLVLCSSDNEEIGKVLFQIGLEKKGDEITLDYENEK